MTLAFIRSCPDDKKCAACSEVSSDLEICAVCHFSVFSRATKHCENPIVAVGDCLIYGENGCVECARGFGLVEGKCEKCKVPGCQKCDQFPIVCDACDGGIRARANACDKNAAKCSVQNCEICDSKDTICFECREGFSLRNGECVESVPGCLASDGKQCIHCRQGFYMKTGHLCGPVDEPDSPHRIPYLILFVAILVIGAIGFTVYYKRRQIFTPTEAPFLNRDV